MNVTLDRAAFLAELQLCAAITPRRPAIPILAAVRIGAEKDRATLGATDLDLTILTSCAAEIVETGELCVEAQVLLEMVRSLDGETVTLTGGESGKPVTVTSGAARFDTPTWPAEDFPVLPQMDGAAEQTMELATLQTMLKASLPPVGETDVRLTIDRICLRFQDGKVTTYGTNGYWISIAEADGERQKKEVVHSIPPQLARLIVKLEAVGNAEAWFTTNDSHVAVTCDHRTLMARQKDGRFPDWDSSIPTITGLAIVSRETFLAVIGRANVATKGTLTKMLVMSFTRGRIGVKHSNRERGDFTETMPAEYTGEDLTVAYNGRTIEDALRTLDCPAVEIGVDAKVNVGTIAPTVAGTVRQQSVIYQMRQ